MTPLVVSDRTARVLLYVVVGGWILTEMWIAIRRRLEPGARVNDRGSQAAVIISVWASVWVAFALTFAVRSATIGWHQRLLFATGLVVMLAGIALRLYAIRVLGRYFTVTVATRPGQRVVQVGPYRWVRHPSYSGSLLTLLGMCLALTSWLAFVGLLPALFGYGYRIRIEEQALVDGLGQEYREYSARTKRIIPYVF